MGITYHPTIGVEKLSAKINARLGTEDPVDDRAKIVPEKIPQVAAGKPLTEAEYAVIKRNQKRLKARSLVRVRVTCMNPNKTEWEGEIISVGSAKVGTHKKYVPFNLDEGYHIPYIIYQAMKERKCTIFYNVKGPRGEKIRKGKLVNEFNIELMDPLTPVQMKELAKQQAMTNAID